VKALLRSVIDYGGSISPENLILNFGRLREAVEGGRYEFDRPDDQRVYAFVAEYFQRRMELPAAGTIAHYFGTLKDVEIEERLKDIAGAEPSVRTNFAYILDLTIAERLRHKAVQLFKEAAEITAKGLEIEGERKFGVREALHHVAAHASEVILPDTKVITARNALADGQRFLAECEEAEAHKGRAWGKFTGLNEIDKACHGIKRGELWIHAAYTGELKSVMALNWGYNLVTRYRTNVLYWSFEMTYEQVCRQLYVRHSANPIWRARGRKPLDYRRVRDGDFSPDEKDFIREITDDLNNNPEYCRFDIRTPDHPVNVAEIRMQTEAAHRDHEVGLLVLDHGQLIEPRKKKRAQDYAIELNEVVRDIKALALQFNHGERIPILLLWQINRDGKDAADKDGGKYKLRALTYANEAEKSADVITTTYLNDDHRSAKTTLICNLKNRDNPLFEPFTAGTNLGCRQIFSRQVFERLPQFADDGGICADL
jgi:replicative DNA helicase